VPLTRTHTGQSDWHIEVSGEGGSENPHCVTVQARTRGTTRLSAAGLVAMVGQANSYYTSSTVAKMFAQSSRTPVIPFAVHISRDHVEMDVLPQDKETVQNALSAILVVAANLTTS
jgi:hypothetical protein